MTYGEAIDEVQEYFSTVQGLGQQMIRRYLTNAYYDIHRKYDFDEVIQYEETFTWATTGTSDTPSGLTRWRGRPLTDGMRNGTQEWQRITPNELAGRSTESDSRNQVGRVVFTITGPSYTVRTAEAIDADTVITVSHYSEPAPLSTDSTALQIPYEFERIPILETIVLIEDHLYRNEGRTLTTANSPVRLQKVQNDLYEMNELLQWNASREQGVRRYSELPPQGKDMVRRQSYRRRYSEGMI